MPAVTDISLGKTVLVRYAKWGGGRHYEFTMSRLGEDEHGVWLGAPEGTTVPEWSRDGDQPSDVVSMVDLDLDVVLRVNGELLIDDEDEFEEHRQSLVYPAEIVTQAQATTAAVAAAIAAGDEPYGRVGQSWLAGYAALTQGR